MTPRQRHYYRVHGPSVLIEYTIERGVGGDAANHVHSIVRDPGNDYGEDWLGHHYKESHNPVFPAAPGTAPPTRARSLTFTYLGILGIVTS